VLGPIDGAVRLNIGCGDCPHASYYNVDNDPNVVEALKGHGYFGTVADAHALPVASESVDVVYASHVLEHYPAFRMVPGQATADDALAEWHRVLKGGGKLYVAVPDLEMIIHECVRGVDLNYQNRWLLNLFGQPRPGWSHCWAYTDATLTAALGSHGFRGIEPFESFLTKPNGDHDGSGGVCDGIPISLNLVATKPCRTTS
jgi:SAM-dependent methyltransferase